MAPGGGEEGPKGVMVVKGATLARFLFNYLSYLLALFLNIPGYPECKTYTQQNNLRYFALKQC